MRPIHIVQVGADEAVFRPSADPEPLVRQRRYGEILEALRPGSSITNLVFARQTDATSFSDGSIRFIPVPIPAYRGGRYIALRRLLAALTAVHREHEVDAVTTQSVHEEGWAALAFCARQRIPVVGQIHYDIFSPFARNDWGGTRLTRAVRFAATRRLLPRFAALRVVGQRIADRITTEGLNRRVVVLPVSVGLVSRPAGAEGNRAPRILFVGRLVAQKDLGTWLDVFERVQRAIPTVEGEVIGDGVLRADLETRARKRMLRIAFRGWVPNQELGAYYSAASVFLLTSTYEGFGRVLVEANAHGVPVVSTRLAGTEDIIVDGRNGFLREPKDSKGLAASVIEILSSDARRAEMGLFGRDFVREKFDPEQLASSWVRLLVDVAESRRA